MNTPSQDDDIFAVRTELAEALAGGHKPAPQTRMMATQPPPWANEDVKKRVSEVQAAVSKLAHELDLPLMVFFGDNYELPASHVCIAPCPKGFQDMHRVVYLLRSLAERHPTMSGMAEIIGHESESAARLEHRRLQKARAEASKE